MDIAFPNNCYFNKMLYNGMFRSKDIYNKLLQDSKLIQKSYTKWCGTLDITEEDWSFYCSVPFKCSSDVNLRWFQYRLLQRIIPSNKYLHLIKAITHDTCTFCHRYVETIEHLFYYCPLSVRLWNHLQTLLNNIDIGIVLDIKTVLFGADIARELNLIIILVKKFIFNCKVRKEIPLQNKLLLFLRDYFLLQKNILLRNMKSSVWRKYWYPWYNFLQLQNVLK